MSNSHDLRTQFFKGFFFLLLLMVNNHGFKYFVSGQAANHIMINEVELNPSGDDRLSTTMEWVELYNPTSSSVDIGGWTLSTTHGETIMVTISYGAVLQPGGYYIVERARWLDNEDECIVLRDATGNEIDRTPILSDTSNNFYAWARFPNGKDTDSSGDWMFQASTKGASNGGEEKQPSTITCTVNPTSIKIMGEITISGAINPVHVGVTVTLTFTTPNGSSFTRLINSTSDGKYSLSLIIGASPNSAGSWKVKASWPGDADHKPAESETVSFRVSKLESQVKATLLENRILPGLPIVINGSIWPSRAGVEVELEYRFKGGIWNHIATVKTDSSSSFSYTWTESPRVTGVYGIRMSWAGDYVYNGSEIVMNFTVAKLYSLISIELSTQALTFGQSIIVNGSIDPPRGNIPVMILCTKPDGTNLTRSSTTSTTGSYVDSFVPDKVGRWVVRASWEGDSSYEGAESNALSFVVNKASTTIVVTISKDSIDQGQSVTVSGSISPSPGRVNVLLTYTRPDGSEVSRTVTTSEDGAFTDTYTPDKEGEWSIKASWLGNENYLGGTSSSLSFVVRRPFPIFIVIGIAAIAVVTLLYVKTRRK